MRIGSLFSGSGMLDEAVRTVVGGDVVWHSEIEPAAVKLLEHRYPGVPNLGDISVVDWAAVPAVDVLTGGFPCQDLSAAGKRLGLHPGTRSGLWEHMAYAINQLRPSLVVVENVRGLLSAEAHSDMEPCTWCVGDGESVSAVRALGAVLGDLAGLGYDTKWVGVRASDVGAPHSRFRVFIVAYPQSNGRHQGRTEPARLQWGSDAAVGGAVDRAAAEPGHPDSVDREGWAAAGLPGETGPQAGSASHPDGDAFGTERDSEPHGDIEGHEPVGVDAAGRVLDWGPFTDAVRRWEAILGRPAPAPTVPNRNGSPRLSPGLPEWMMGWPSGWVTAVPGLSSNEMLRVAGNGVVPQQAAYALRTMLNEPDLPNI